MLGCRDVLLMIRPKDEPASTSFIADTSLIHIQEYKQKWLKMMDGD